MSSIRTIKDVQGWEDLVHPETGDFVLIKAQCDDEIAVPKEFAAEIDNGTRTRPTLCAVCLGEWVEDSHDTLEELKEMKERGEVNDSAVVRARDEWRSAKVSLMNQMQLENAWTDEEEATALEPKMSAAWMENHEGRDGTALIINECPQVKTYKETEPVAGTKHEIEEDSSSSSSPSSSPKERPSKRPRTDY